MKDAEQTIERVLAGLREVDVPQGMEGRILRTMEERTLQREVQYPWHFWRKMPGYAGPFASGLVVAGVAVVAVFLPLMHKPAPLLPPDGGLRVAAIRGRVSFRANEVSHPGSSRVGDPMADDLPQELLSKKASRSSAAEVSIDSDTRIVAVNTTETLPTDPDALAISEMLAPSKPAPPLPLTHQERLLAKVVHKGEPEALATLRPDVRAKQMEISKAEFEDFFEPPPVKDNE